MEVLNRKLVNENVLPEKNNCSVCGIFSDLAKANIYKEKQGYRSWCVSCEKQRKDNWRHQNKEHHNNKSKEWVRNNPEKRKEIVEAYKLVNPDAGKQARAAWRKENKDKVNYSTAKRRKRIQAATPNLNEWDEFYMQELYHIAGLRNLEVDHIIPLIHEKVCGLHCPNNLQLLTKSENSSKGNKWDFTNANC